LVHRREIHRADHEPIVDRDLFDAVQARMTANNVEKRLKGHSSPYLLTGLIFDSAGNRMSPTHTCKKGVRYRYYVSQAVEQRRRGEAGVMNRVPAPDVETQVNGLVSGRLGTPGTMPSREAVKALVYKVTVLADTLEVTLRPTLAPENPDSASIEPPVIVSLPWARKPFVAEKGVALEPSASVLADPRARDAVLAAIGKARLWIDEILAGSSFAQIAKREGKGERQIRLLAPLAFVTPTMVRGLVEGAPPLLTVTEMAKSVPLIWP
jgi:hypothetical protein